MLRQSVSDTDGPFPASCCTPRTDTCHHCSRRRRRRKGLLGFRLPFLRAGLPPPDGGVHLGTMPKPGRPAVLRAPTGGRVCPMKRAGALRHRPYQKRGLIGLRMSSTGPARHAPRCHLDDSTLSSRPGRRRTPLPSRLRPSLRPARRSLARGPFCPRPLRPTRGPSPLDPAKGKRAKIKGQLLQSTPAHNATRKPTPLARMPGSRRRYAERQTSGSSYHEPPRSTRPAPEVGPGGSTTFALA